MLFNEKLLNSDKLKPHYNNNISGAAVNIFKINNNFLNIDINNNNIKPAFFQPAKILYNINAYIYIYIYILIYSTYNIHPKSSLHQILIS